MPYVVRTGKRSHYLDSGVGGVQVEPSRLAVATLESQDGERIGVKELLRDAVIGSDRPDVCPRLSLTTDECLRFNAQIEVLPESGGTVGPLPDGTTIQVERVLWSVLAEDVGVELRWDPPTQDGDYLHAAQREELEAVLAAWNAKHGQT